MRTIRINLFFIALLLSITIVISAVPSANAGSGLYIASQYSDVFHEQSCRYVRQIASSNKIYFLSIGSAKHSGRNSCHYCAPTRLYPYDKGYEDGYDYGYSDGYDEGKGEGYESGYNVGCKKGAAEILEQKTANDKRNHFLMALLGIGIVLSYLAGKRKGRRTA